MGSKKLELCIRADANDFIGTGHVMRCLSIAEQIRLSGEKVCFIISDDNSRQMIESKGLEVICLDSVWNDLETETDKLVEVLKSRRADALLIYTYYVTFQYLSKLKEYTKTIYMDDLHKFAYPVDVLINYNIYADEIDYPGIYGGINVPDLLTGCRYVPLREEFSDIKRNISCLVSKVLVTTGGTDNYNVTGNLIESFMKKEWFSDTDFYFVLGRFNRNIEKLKSLYGGYSNIHFLINIPDMDRYMKMCDIAITAGGSTTYELCACGLPSIMYTLADNQLEMAETVSKQKLIPWVGDVRTDLSVCLKGIERHIEAYRKNYEQRCRISERMQKLCDGQGCKRIVKAIKAGMSPDAGSI